MVRAGDDPRRSSRLLPLRGLLGGLVVGAVWGALARLWMRLITTEEPEFTWSGSLFVVGLFAVTGMLGGLVYAARHRGWRGRPMVALRVLGVVPLLLLAAGPGAVLAPTLLLGGLALARDGWPRWVRAGLAALAVAAVAWVHVDAAQDWPHSAARLLGAVVLCLLVYGGAAAALAQSFTATPGATVSPRVLLLALPVLALPLLSVVGFRSVSGPEVPLAAAVSAALLVGAVVLLRRRRTARPVPPPPTAAVPGPPEQRPAPPDALQTGPAGVTPSQRRRPGRSADRDDRGAATGQA